MVEPIGGEVLRDPRPTFSLVGLRRTGPVRLVPIPSSQLGPIPAK